MKLFKKEQPFKERLIQILNIVKNHHSKLNLIKYRLKSREKILFERLSQTNKSELAKILANEIAEIRKLESNLEGILLSLESFMLRAETVLQLDEFTRAISPIPRMIYSIKEEASKISPYLSNEMEELMNNIENLKIYYPEGSFNIAINEEVESILKEAAEIATKKIDTNLPEIPVSTADKKPIRLLEAEGYGVSEKREFNPLEDKVLRYIIENSGRINLKKCSEDLGIEEAKLSNIIEDLIKQGRLQRIR